MNNSQDDGSETASADEHADAADTANGKANSRTSDSWAETDALFKAALEHPPDARAAFVERAAVPTTIRTAVLRLLRADEAAGTFLETPLISTPANQKPDDLRQHIGPYRLVGVAGTGGMGTVYLAERDDDAFDRRVVIKLLRHDATSTEYRRHLESERRHLARLEHPNVARLYDGGTTEDGHPYLVIEHVEGEPIDVYCVRHAPTIDDRLDLFLQLCDAVAFAHHHLLIHCDLKPANVLVTPPEGEREPCVKLLDFGIARLHSAGRATESSSSPVAMTPHYASPEQTRGEPLSVTTDIYSLGVMLFELMTGRSPDPVSGGASTRDRTPFRPQLVRPHDHVPGAPLRLGGPPPVPRAWRNDLEHIIAHAMAHRPEDRYTSVAELADDIRRCRAARPVRAVPASWVDRTLRTIRRNRIRVLAVAVAAAGMATVILVLVTKNRTLTDERRQVTQVEDLLEHMIASANPRITEQAVAPTALSVIDQSAEALAKGLPDPRSEAKLAVSVARAYVEIGREQRAARVIAETIDRLAPRMPEMTPETNELAGLLGITLMRLGKLDEAETVLRSVEWHWRELEGNEHPEIYLTQGAMANVFRLQGRLDEAESLASAALRSAEPLLGDDVRLAKLYTVKGFVLVQIGLVAEAESFLRKALAHRKRILGPRHVEVAASLNNLGTVLSHQDRQREAMAAWREALDIWEERLPDQAHPMVATTLHNVATSALSERDLETAERAARRSLALGNEAYEDDEADAAPTVGILTEVLRLRGDLEAAEAMARRELDATDFETASRAPIAAAALARMAHVLVVAGKLDEAESTLIRATALQDQALPATHPARSHGLMIQGELAERRGDQTAAFIARKQAHALRATLTSGHWLLAETGAAVGASLLALGNSLDARRYLDDAHTIYLRRFGADDERTRDTRSLLDEATARASTAVVLHARPKTP